ncbi:MAG TPA: topoisomerase DNA-binding C4 zinc finger domain-containing protein, partial [Candidatus Acidoferrum sp.]|nr:topoisomerase DNA-binding C4 zinc finger domain-containing protein [Candidatus Acidoferrum sp.]
EGKLDALAERGGDWEQAVQVLAAFYGPFEKELEEAERKLPKFEQKDEPTDEVCPNCGKMMVIKTGRFGRFMSCSGYPECKTTKPILKDTGVKCPKCGGMIAERRSRKGRTFYGCANYPACDFVSWDRLAQQPCAVCGDYVIEKPRRGGNVVYICHTDKTHNTGLGANAGNEDAEAELEPV